jgi:hypothetical protein
MTIGADLDIGNRRAGTGDRIEMAIRAICANVFHVKTVIKSDGLLCRLKSRKEYDSATNHDDQREKGSNLPETSQISPPHLLEIPVVYANSLILLGLNCSQTIK